MQDHKHLMPPSPYEAARDAVYAAFMAGVKAERERAAKSKGAE